ncbi:hypothetical protein ACE6H2_011091 [Prunus campanulata]
MTTSSHTSGGNTKILAVDRNIKLSTFTSKLASLCDTLNDILRIQRDQVGALMVRGPEFGQIESLDGSTPTAPVMGSSMNPNRILSVWVVVVLGCVVEVEQGREVVGVATRECGG